MQRAAAGGGAWRIGTPRPVRLLDLGSMAGLLARGSSSVRAFPVSQWHAVARIRRSQLRGQPQLRGVASPAFPFDPVSGNHQRARVMARPPARQSCGRVGMQKNVIVRRRSAGFARALPTAPRFTSDETGGVERVTSRRARLADSATGDDRQRTAAAHRRSPRHPRSVAADVRSECRGGASLHVRAAMRAAARVAAAIGRRIVLIDLREHEAGGRQRGGRTVHCLPGCGVRRGGRKTG